MNYEFRWKEPAVERDHTVSSLYCGYDHSDPTADAAIRIVMKEEKKKRKKQKKQKKMEEGS